MTEIAPTFEAPYYAVIFTSLRSEGDNGYSAMANQMLDLASKQPGYLGVDSAREGIGITVSYWRDLQSIRAWKAQIEHRRAQKLGRDLWYEKYTVRIAKVEREYDFKQ